MAENRVKRGDAAKLPLAPLAFRRLTPGGATRITAARLMCGIVALVARPGRFVEADVARAVASIHHRGPDGSGVARVHRNEHWEVFFGHARLSILDLSDAGRQPMVREDRGAIVFNGEIYDHASLRSALVPADWELRSRTDTEVLFASMLESPEAALRAANGMLAVALFDERAERLVLARDRLGKKPLFVYQTEDVLAVASELKCFEALGLKLTLDETGLAHFRWLSYVPGPRSIWRECRKFEPATWASVDLRRPTLGDIEPRSFWDPLGGFTRRFSGSYADAMDQVSSLIDDATRIRLEADVPVGVFLSGGIDSSLIAASVAKQHDKHVRAFVVKAADPRLDESERALATARHLGLDVQVLPLDPARYGPLIDLVPFHFDEPHAASSQIAVMAMSEAAKRHVTVVLTGDGGDELFLGYPWIAHPRTLRVPRGLLARLPGSRVLLRGLRTPGALPAVARLVAALGLEPRSTAKKLRILEDALDLPRSRDVYELFMATRLRSMLSPSDRALLDPRPFFDTVRGAYPGYAWEAAIGRDMFSALSALDTVTYLRDDVLQKVDRGTMAFGLEARSPLLDYRIVELAQSLPTSFKAQRGTFKRILRDLAARVVDPALARRPKSGFGIAEPAGMPAGETPLERWNTLIEARWAARWLPHGSPS